MRKDTIHVGSDVFRSSSRSTVSVALGKAQCRLANVMQGRAQPNMRLKLSARGRRQKRKAQTGLFSLVAPAAGCSLCAIR
jgi:hypothetical protein